MWVKLIKYMQSESKYMSIQQIQSAFLHEMLLNMERQA